MTLATARLLVLILSLAPAPAKADDDAREAATTFLNAGATMFDARDAKGLAATYEENAVLLSVTRDKDSGDLKTETRSGRADIEKAYGEMFKNDPTYHARNTITEVRKVGDDVLIVSGNFEPDTTSTTPMKVPFVQVRKKTGESWKVVTMQVLILVEK